MLTSVRPCRANTCLVLNQTASFDFFTTTIITQYLNKVTVAPFYIHMVSNLFHFSNPFAPTLAVGARLSLPWPHWLSLGTRPSRKRGSGSETLTGSLEQKTAEKDATDVSPHHDRLHARQAVKLHVMEYCKPLQRG